MYSSSSIPQNVRVCAKYQGCGPTNSSVSQVQYQDTMNNYEVERCQKPGFVFQADNQLHDPITTKESECYTEVVAKYIGTLAMPKTWDHRTQAVSNAVKRMKESRATHTIVKIKLCSDGIRLYDARGNLLVHHSAQGVAKFGLSSTDELLFCLVTHDRKDENSGPSCHIFYTDPQMARHRVHERTAECFGIRCEINIDSDNCVEFPSSAQFAIDLFQKFYVSTLAGSHYNNSNLDIPLIVPSGFESQFNMCCFHNSRDSTVHKETDKIVDSIMEKCQNNEASSEIHRWTSVTSYRNHLLKCKMVSGELDKTAVFPAENSYNCSALKNNSHSSENDFESLNVAVNYSKSAYDQVVKDSQNSVENLRKQSQKLLLLNPESGGTSLHATKFCAYEKNGLDPESPLPVLPLRTITNRNHHLELLSQITSTPILKQMMTLRSYSVDAPTVCAPHKVAIMPDELPCHQNSTLLADNSILPSGNVSLISAKVSSVAQNVDKDLAANAANVRIAYQAKYPEEVLCKEMDQKLKLDIVEKPNRKNVSFHGSFESVFCECELNDSERSFRPPLGSCREMATTSEPREIGRVAGWAVAFDKLLNDADGVALFKEHLKKEFNEENLQFWLKCEEYKRIPEVQRKDFAAEIYNTHVDPEAQECVNIDQDIMNAVKDSLHLATIDVYETAQRHIYQLMKQDCYPRFKTSQLFRDAVLAEMEGKPFQLPYGQKDLSLNFMSVENDPNPKTDSSREDRRKSLLFWQKKKLDTKNKAEYETDEKNGNGLLASEVNRKLSDLKSTIDVKVTTPDGSVTQLKGHHGQKIADVLLKLGTKLNSGLTFVEALNQNTSAVLDVTKDVKTLSCKEILLIDCIIFRLTLPDEKSLAVRCRHKTSVSKCIEPILRKHGFEFDKVVMHIAGEGVILKQKMCVDSINCRHVMVESLLDSRVGRRKRPTPAAAGRLPTEIYKRSISMHTDFLNSSDSSSSRVQFQLEDLFSDVFYGTVDFSYIAFDEQGTFNLEKLSKLRGQQNVRHFTLPSRGLSNKRNGTSEYNNKRSTSSAAEDESFINMLVSAQSRQLNDQRGKLKREDIVLPDFLKEPGCANALPQTRLKPSYHFKTSDHRTDYGVYGVAANNYFVTPSVSSSSCSMSSSTDCDNVYSTDTCSDESWNFGNDPHKRPSRCTDVPDLDCQFSELTDARNEVPNKLNVCSLKLLEKQTDGHTGKHDLLLSKANQPPSEQISYQFTSSDPKIALPSSSHLCQYKSSYV